MASPSLRIGFFSVGLAFGALFLWLALRDLDTTSFLAALSSAALWPIAPFFVAQILYFWLKAERWRLLIGAEFNVDTRHLVDPMMIGIAANNIFPFRAGEIIRTYIAGDSLKIPKALILATLIVERFFDILSIAIIVTVGLAFIFINDHRIGGTRSVLLAALLATVVSAVVLLMLPRLARADPRWIVRFLPARLRARVTEHLLRFSEGFAALSQRHRIYTLAANSLVQWLLMALCIYMSFLAVGIDVPTFAMATTVLGLIVFGISMPSSPGFVGTIEYAFVLGLGVFGINSDESLATAIYYHSLTFGFITLSGAICYTRYRLRLKRLSSKTAI